MQDKEFDQLFKNAFNDAEVTPSRDLWSNIEADLQPKKSKKQSFYWIAAAAVLIVATVTMILSSQKEEKIQIANQNPIKEIFNNNQDLDQPVSGTTLNGSGPSKAVSVTNVVKQATKAVQQKVRPIENNLDPVSSNTDLSIKQEQVLAKTTENRLDPIVKQKIIQPEIIEEPIFAVVTDNTETKQNLAKENDETGNKGIRNVGDLVNLVVNKVDKRKDKFIQFRTDDDDSSLASINIGPFKFGKRNKNK